MKKRIIPFIALALLACNNPKKENGSATSADTAAVSPTATEATTADTSGTFDINKIPVSDKELGQFPYLTLPANYTYNYSKEIAPGDIREPDKEYFAVNGKLMPQTGKTYKANLEKDRSKDEKRFNSLVVEEALKKQIEDLGGVQVNNVPVPKSEIDRVGNAELIDKRYGSSIDINLIDQIKTFVIRTKAKQVWIQMTLMNDESGKITVLEK